MKIHQGDSVMVITGKYKGVTGKVLRVFSKEQQVLVEGIRVMKKHVKPSEGKPGGIVSKESPIHVSNVLYLENGQPVRIGYRLENGKKVRFSKKTGRTLS